MNVKITFTCSVCGNAQSIETRINEMGEGVPLDGWAVYELNGDGFNPREVLNSAPRMIVLCDECVKTAKERD